MGGALIRIGRARAVLLGSLAYLTLAGVFGPAAVCQPSPPLAAQENRPPKAWAEVVPFSPRGEISLLRFSGSATGLALDPVAAGAALVCLGGEGLAIDCREIELATDTVVEPWLAPGAFVRGRILLGREPLAGAGVAVVGAGYRLRRSYLLPLTLEDGEPVRWVETADDGAFELPQLAPGDYRLEVKRPGGKGELTEPFTVPPREALLPRGSDFDTAAEPSAPELLGPATASPADTALDGTAPRRAVLDLGAVTLEPGLEVLFSVLTFGGEPLEGAQVGGIQTDGPAEAPTHYSARTDREGRAVITGTEPGVPFEVSCRAEGFAIYRERFPSPPTDVVCVLAPLAAVRGRVIAEGEPVAGATASLQPAPGSQPGDRSTRRTTSDARGEFDFAELTPGSRRLVVAAPGFRVEERRFDLVPGETRELPTVELAPASEVHGVVVDAETGEPVAGVTVVSLQPVGAVDTVTDDEGRFRFAADAPGGLRLQLTAAAYPTAVVELAPETLHEDVLPSDAGHENGGLRLELAPGGRVEAVVYDEATGKPCLGCDLVHYRADGHSEVAFGALHTGADGTARSGWLAPGTYRVVLERVRTHGTTVSVHSGDDTREVEVQAHRASRVVFGAPRDTLRVQLWPPPPSGWRIAAGDGTGWRTYTPDLAGRFELKRVPGSAVRLRLQGGRGEPVTVSLATVPADYDEPRLDLELPRTLVRGRVAADPGSASGPLRALSLTAAEARAWTLTRRDGTFELPFLPPDSYLLILGENEVATFSLAAGQELELETELPVDFP